ncbi:hypothetical protein ACIBG0_38375 [Nocardia sp. NPDC050630]|uniref:hypothetical protein n=1 Tax=Nocardia sp. NPDC050630 TaxID=3364321 RepID=UPI0037928195
MIGAVATAQTDTGEQVSSVSSGLSWMGVHDSQGVQLSKYSFVTNTGGVMHLGNTIMSTPLLLLYAGWYVIQTSAIWFIGWVLSFAWLNWLGSILREVAVNLTAQIATSLMLVTAGTIGAFFVAYFVTRGFYAKAAMQVVSMLAVAIFGALFLADPLGDVL